MPKTKTGGERGRPRASERSPEATRAQLLDAATKVFAERGYRAATVDEIVAEALAAAFIALAEGLSSEALLRPGLGK